MTDFLFGAAGFVATMIAIGLFRLLYGPADADRMMAAQLLGTGGGAVLLLLATANQAPPVVDVALLLALLAAFASVGFIRSAHESSAQQERDIG